MKFNLSGYVVNDTTTIRLRVDKEDLMIFLSKIIDPDDPKGLYRDHDVFYDGPYKYKGIVEDKRFILRLLISLNTTYGMSMHEFIEGEMIEHTNGVAITLKHYISKFQRRKPLVLGVIVSAILVALLINKFIMHADFNLFVILLFIYILGIISTGILGRSSRVLDIVKRDFINFAEYKLQHRDNNYSVLGKL